MQVVAKLRRSITEGLFRPGDRLVERALVEMFQVSRSSIREALRQLEAERLIEIIPNAGPIVRSVGPDEAAELYDLRAVVEGLCASYFAERGTDEEVVRLEAAALACETALQNGDAAAIIATKNAYYDAFVAGSHSGTIGDYVLQLNARMAFLWSSSLQRPGRADQGI
jgi:DNA-binding GntR family transcriptional regulator